MTIEYRALWPTGNLVDQIPPTTDKGLFMEQFEKFTSALTSLQVPKEYFPRPHSEPVFQTYQDYTPQHPSARHRQEVWEPTPYQVERVVTRQFGWNDPCVICGGQFPKCHEPWETEAFVNRVKSWLKARG